MWVRWVKVHEAIEQTEGIRHTLCKRYEDKASRRILAAYRCHIVESSERDPIVNPEEKHLEYLQYQQNNLDANILREDV